MSWNDPFFPRARINMPVPMAMMVAKIKAMPKLFAGLSCKDRKIFTKVMRVQHLS
jgi:hypothetical protein